MSSYHQFLKTVRELITLLPKAPTVLVLYGESSYLIHKATRALCIGWQRDVNDTIHRWPANTLERSQFIGFYEQASLFDASTLNIISKLKSQAEMAKWIKGLNKEPSSTIIITVESSELNKGLDQALRQVSGQSIRCRHPNRADFAVLISQLGRNRKISLTSDAVTVLNDVFGDDYFSLENEFNRIALLYPNGVELTAQNARQMVKLPSNKHVFELSDKLLRRDAYQAEQVMHSLLAKQESVLAITGILARHCRTALEISLDRQAKLPFGLIKRYNQYTRELSRIRLLKALRLCQDIDALTKSSRQDTRLHLFRLLDLLV